MLEQIKYIVKSKLGDIFIDNEKFEKVEKLRYSHPANALEGYQEQINKGYSPMILKKCGKDWKEVELEQVAKELKQNKKGVKKH